MVGENPASDQLESNMINNVIHEFLPWHKWVALPGNRNLPLDEQKRKYDIERNEHFKKLLYYETVEQVKNAAK